MLIIANYSLDHIILIMWYNHHIAMGQTNNVLIQVKMSKTIKLIKKGIDEDFKNYFKTPYDP